jgi:hypothetical protein
MGVDEVSARPKADQVSINVFDLIDSICADFRRQWKAGERPRIEDFLRQVPEDGRAQLFRNLLSVEMRYRNRAGDRANPDEYVRRFPDYRRVVGDAFQYSTSLSMEEIKNTPADDSEGITITIEAPAANRIGDYELVRELGRGGFGVVYEAQHIKSGNCVALKTLPTGHDGQKNNADRLYRFRRELRSLSARGIRRTGVSSGMRSRWKRRLFVGYVHVDFQRRLVLDQQSHHLGVVVQADNGIGQDLLQHARVHHLAERQVLDAHFKVIADTAMTRFAACKASPLLEGANSATNSFVNSLLSTLRLHRPL